VDEEGLLAAIDESPGQVGPREAYADWLRDRGDSRYQYLDAERRLREAPLGAPSRRELGRAWRELRAAQDPAWLRRLEPEAPIPAWLPAEARRPPRLGLDDWHEWASESHYEWVVLAVLAPIEAVVRAVIEARTNSSPGAALASGPWEKNVPVGPARNGDSVADGIPFVQLRGHAWTVAMYDTFRLSLESQRAALSDAATLSDRLGTLAVVYAAEDTSGATGYELFECGERIEFAEWAPGEEVVFESRRRPPPGDEALDDFDDDLFRALGLYVPGFYAGWDAVRVGILEPTEVARADVLSTRKLTWDVEPRELPRTDDGLDRLPRPPSPGEVGPEGAVGDDADNPF
jgi:uncharacterized protein (TIGR02996 family)